LRGSLQAANNVTVSVKVGGGMWESVSKKVRGITTQHTQEYGKGGGEGENIIFSLKLKNVFMW
jgi:hypothetical protein